MTVSLVQRGHREGRLVDKVLHRSEPVTMVSTYLTRT